MQSAPVELGSAWYAQRHQLSMKVFRGYTSKGDCKDFGRLHFLSLEKAGHTPLHCE